MTCILVVESDKEVLSFIIRLLERAGYQALSVPCWQEAVAQAGRRPIDGIIFDLARVGRSIETPLAQLRSNEHTKHVPVIALTTRGDLTQQIAQAAGYAGLIAKPFHISDFLEQIAIYIAPIA